MIMFLHKDPRFQRSLRHLLRRGGAAAAAVKKAEEIIRRVMERGQLDPHSTGKVTDNSEHRLRNCFKFELVSGYRLICLRQNGHLVLLYAGNHEECQRWLENNKGCSINVDETPAIATKAADSGSSTTTQFKTEADQYEEQLMRRLDDALLRKIFCGICSNE